MGAGRGKRKGKKMFQSKGKNKCKASDERKITNDIRSRDVAREVRRLRPNKAKGSNIINDSG